MNKFILKMRGREMTGGRGLALCGTIALVLLLANGPALEAAPVTFAFEATVIQIVDKSGPKDLPFTVESGDVLKGKFTFEPVDAEPAILGSPPGPEFIVESSTNTTQELGFSVMLGDTILATSKYSLRAIDNRQAISESDIPSFFDIIGPSCHVCTQGTISGVDSEVIWGFSMTLSGDESVLSGADIPASPEEWNQFARRRISITFQKQGVVGEMRAFAQIGQFTLVPEPSSSSLILSVVVSGLAARTGRKSRNQR